MTRGAAMSNARPTEAVVEQRRQDVLNYVIDRGEARIGDLASVFGVSLMTMHRDLDDLAGRRMLRKKRGLVEAFPPQTMETATRFRAGLHTAEKEAISAAAAARVRPGASVLLDDSSTLFPLARMLGEVEELTAVTNSVTIARILSLAGREVVLAGGRYRAEFDSCTGPDVLRSLSRLRTDIAFMSVTTIARGRMYHPIQDYAEIKHVMHESAERTFLLADHSKFGKTATYAHGDAAIFDVVITDDATPQHELDAIRDLGTDVEVVSPNDPVGHMRITPESEEWATAVYARRGGAE
ncbi:DeoR family transcriptional regulator of sugar metabolism [Saccharopolyspora erythraea NRRL 2338]|uniref:Lactose phosphotransferase system repressor n=3 Tax=Saccharopolyspora erythraea TaxID=1836 RepID=A4F887_SACEN|nr:DeoR faimly transcriptional regulator [Saccharopolyspora erythraea D]CAM00262.1 DeoR family transcriptional regulator of sugar metabolism [Saccharopolyspora erythraea NRRL 2338]